MSNPFTLHERLAADTALVGETELCQVLLMQDSRFPWVILVPKRPDLRELYELDPMDQILLMGEVGHIAQEMQGMFGATKTNVAALGNMVAQLHIHVIMRTEDDAAWPAPVWGQGTATPYDTEELDATLEMVRACLP